MKKLRVASADDIPEGRALGVEIDGSEYVLCRINGEICALSGLCTHEARSLDGGEVEDGVLTCPWHGARFDVGTGRALSLPAIRPLDTFPVDIDGAGRVVLLLAEGDRS